MLSFQRTVYTLVASVFATPNCSLLTSSYMYISLTNTHARTPPPPPHTHTHTPRLYGLSTLFLNIYFILFYYFIVVFNFNENEQVKQCRQTFGPVSASNAIVDMVKSMVNLSKKKTSDTRKVRVIQPALQNRC